MERQRVLEQGRDGRGISSHIYLESIYHHLSPASIKMTTLKEI